ncbi:MAG: glycosyltransferase family 2 protein [Woeseiaceae bacterium]|nr:glycosyltransferase family 2 protein [Woeseiaceae bacterium]
MAAKAIRIVAILTCHNRRAKTLGCLENLYSQDAASVTFDVILVDDGSSDGTTEAVRNQFPAVRIIPGDGSLFWTGGMRVATKAALETEFDFLLWLNDDTVLYPDAISRLLVTHDELATSTEKPLIIVGSVCDPDTKAFTYGGSVSASRWMPLRFSHVLPGGVPAHCDTFNGNCVLFSAAAVRRLGNLHPKLVHAAGDYEYGLRAGRLDIENWIAPGLLGECGRNPTEGTWLDMSLPLIARYKLLFSRKGQPPRERLAYYAAHGGPLWPLVYPLVYLRPLGMSLARVFGQSPGVSSNIE